MIFIKNQISTPKDIIICYQDIKNRNYAILIYAEEPDPKLGIFQKSYYTHMLVDLKVPNSNEAINALVDIDASFSCVEDACAAVERLLELCNHTLMPSEMLAYL